MTDKEFRCQKKRVHKLVNERRDRLGLGNYRLHNSYSKERKEDSPSCGAQTDMRWEYLEADFTWYLPNLIDLDDEQLQECVVHEYCHILVSPLSHEDTETGRIVYERVTSTIQRAILYTREGRR